MKIIFMFVTCFVITVTSYPQTVPVPQSPDELQDAIKAILKQEDIAGVMLGIATKDSVLFSGGFGYADVATQKEVTSKTLFRMGSVTKMFVSLGIMKLVKAGKISLNDKLNDIAPEVTFENTWERSYPVRIIHLLEHTSGFDDMQLNNLYSFDKSDYSGISMVKLHQHSLICRWKPGERSAYSNPNYVILGYIIEKITGKKYDRYLKEIILNPLSMDDSNFNTTASGSPNETKEYVVQQNEFDEVPHVTLLSGPQGSLWSNADDMVKFIQLFLRDGAPVVSRDEIDEIETSHSSLAARRGLKTGYALGNRYCFLTSPLPFRGHDGLAGTCYSGCYYNRNLNIGFTIASNSNVSNAKIENLIVSYLERHMIDSSAMSQPLNEKSITPVLGWYQFDSPRNEISGFVERLQNMQRVYVKSGCLYTKPIMGMPIPLKQTSAMTFAYPDMSLPLILFTTNDSGDRVMCIGGAYYRKISTAKARAKLSVVMVALLLIASSLLLTLISLLALTRRKLSFVDAAVRCMPAVGLIFLLWAIANLIEVRQVTYKIAELRSINAKTLIIFTGTSVFALCSTWYSALILRQVLQKKTCWPTWFQLPIAVAFLWVTFVLLANGWIALRTWAL